MSNFPQLPAPSLISLKELDSEIYVFLGSGSVFTPTNTCSLSLNEVDFFSTVRASGSGSVFTSFVSFPTLLPIM